MRLGYWTDENKPHGTNGAKCIFILLVLPQQAWKGVMQPHLSILILAFMRLLVCAPSKVWKPLRAFIFSRGNCFQLTVPARYHGRKRWLNSTSIVQIFKNSFAQPLQHLVSCLCDHNTQDHQHLLTPGSWLLLLDSTFRKVVSSEGILWGLDLLRVYYLILLFI